MVEVAEGPPRLFPTPLDVLGTARQDCPMGGQHHLHDCKGREHVACRKCHKTWRREGEALTPTWP